MDHDLAWWVHVVFERWRERPGPRYQRLAAALLDAVDTGTVRPGWRLPAERTLADGLGVSRGTVVAAFEHLAAAGVARRRQGSGTFVASRPSWIGEPAGNPAAALLRRRSAARMSIDLSLSAPPGVDHLPTLDWADALRSTAGHGLDPAGPLELRERVAAHLTEHQQLPTSADELVITAGAQQAVALLAMVVGRRATIVCGCPTYPGLVSAAAAHDVRIMSVPGDATAGPAPDSVGRTARKADQPVVFVMPTGANPTGAVMPRPRRDHLLDEARSAGALVVEDLTLADLTYCAEVSAPLAALDDGVVSIGSADKLLWGGLRIGWMRAPEPLRATFLRAKAAADLAPSGPSALVTAHLLGAVDAAWLTALRRALAGRRDHLSTQLSARLPSWRVDAVPEAGLSLWVRLPVTEADGFSHTAYRHGVVVAPGSTACVCKRHRAFVRLSFAHPVAELDLAAERLATAWESYCEDVAST